MREIQFIPATEAAVLLRRSREAVVRQIQRGDLAGKREGGTWFVDRAALKPQSDLPPAT